MTTVDMDRASIELANAVAAVAERYGLTASALFYVLKGLEAQVADARITELLTAPDPTAEQGEPPKDTTETKAAEVKTVPRNHASLKDIQKILEEKIAAGDVDANGKAHCSLEEAAERGRMRNDSSEH